MSQRASTATGRTALLPAQSALDDVSAAWVDGLTASGEAHETCVTALHTVLLNVARHEVARRARSLQVYGPELEDVAQQATNDALMAIRAKVSTFRGESRFTTWAFRFVMFEVSTKMRRHFWHERRVSWDDATWDLLPDRAVASPEMSLERLELIRSLRHAIDHDLTPRQRRVFVAIALNEVPMDAFARELGITRNALYKTLFDARRKVRVSMVAAGYARPSSALRAS